MKIYNYCMTDKEVKALYEWQKTGGKREIIIKLVCIAIVVFMLYFFSGCASMELKQHKGVCRHDALFVASVLVDHYPPESVFIEVSQSIKKTTHAQAYVMNQGTRIYFSRWHNIAVESPRDEVAGKIIHDYTIKQFINSSTKWRL